MPNNRDDFSQQTKDLLANRVGRKCSNPNCGKLTCGANDNPSKYTNIGVAAHICAAAPGGPRYDDNMSPEERKSSSNGIWLCQSCSKLIDSDTERYSKEVLISWKKIAETAASVALSAAKADPMFEQDKEIIMFFTQCFDRPAFRDDICQEGRMEDFEKAIEDTSIAINTGVLRTRDGAILKKSEGKSAIRNPIWRKKLDIISDDLVSIRKKLTIAKKEGAFTVFGTGEDTCYCFNDRELGKWFNSAREKILKELSSICRDVGLQGLHFHRKKYRW